MLWGDPEHVHMQNMEQLHAHDHHQNVTERSKATEYDLKCTHIYTTEELVQHTMFSAGHVY